MARWLLGGDLPPAAHSHWLRDVVSSGKVVDQGYRAVLVRGRERDLELARQELADLVADEVANERRAVRSDVVELVVAHAGPRVAGDVADSVAARLAAGQPHLAEDPQDLLRLAQWDVVELEVLARRDVALDQWRELLRDACE